MVVRGPAPGSSGSDRPGHADTLCPGSPALGRQNGESIMLLMEHTALQGLSMHTHFVQATSGLGSHLESKTDAELMCPQFIVLLIGECPGQEKD